MQIAWILSLFFAVVIALFAVQNNQTVTVSFLAWRLEGVAVSAVILAAAAIGALLTYLFGLGREIRRRMALRGNRSTIRDQEALIADLRAQVRDLERENALHRGRGEPMPPEQGTEPLGDAPTRPATLRPGGDDDRA